MRIALVVSSLDAGGAERVVSGLANRWAGYGHEIAVITLHPPASDFYELSPLVERVSLGLVAESSNPAAAVLMNLRRMRRIRIALTRWRPSVAISFIDRMNVLVLAATAGTRTPIIVSERVDPREHIADRATSALRPLLYRRADTVVVQTTEVAEWVRRQGWNRSIEVIPNAVDGDVIGPVRLHEPNQHRLVAAGRLVPQKGFDLLLAAFAVAAQAVPGWRLAIYGDGPERERLQQQATDLGIADLVDLPGTVPNLPAELRSASVFILSSRYEGFPNVLAEAMALGLAVVSFRCRSGPGDLITDDVDGILVAPEDEAALALALIRVMSDGAVRQRLATRAAGVRDRLHPSTIDSEWFRVVEAVRSHLARASS
jgi:glycosyltransferase involved in cell wall biosynthesis